MEGAVVGGVVGAAVQTALVSLLPVLKEDINHFWDFKSNLEKLQRSLLMINDVLRQADMQHVTDEPAKRWLRKLESVVYEADDALDEFNYQVLRKKLDSHQRLRNKVRRFFTKSNPIALRQKLGHKIRDINKELESINQEASNFGLQSRLARVASARLRGGADVLAVRETDSFTNDSTIVGREDDVSKIVNMLITNSTRHEFSIVPIVGMGGLGKTTLARLVFKERRIKNHFGNLIWVYVSENFDALAIFKRILERLKIDVAIQSREVVLSELEQKLGDKRYLLVLDDVWNEQADKWDNFINSLSGISSVKGNGIIVTTRSEKVASIVKTLSVYRLKNLSGENCWSIIKAKAFNKRQEVPIEFETMGNAIAERCQGLPLAAKVVGGLLWDKSEDDWLSIQHTWLSNFTREENIVMKILKFSFDNLSSPLLKKCFAYCSIFKKGDLIISDRLIELWMAEGFLQTDEHSDMEATGGKFFDILLQNSLLQVVDRNKYGAITSCSMHDLVHDLACYVSGLKCNSGNSNTLDDTYRVRYIDIESIKDESSLLSQARYLRTLFFKGQVPNKMFLEFKHLRTLILIGVDVKSLPILIGSLIHLRLLCITRTRIDTLPDSIGELHHLQTLRAGGYLKTLPNTLTNLISLRHLHIPKKVELPPEMGQLACLRTLPYFKVGFEKGYQISEVGSLKNLRGELEIFNLERVRDKDEAESADLFHKTDLYGLKLVWNEPKNGEINDEDVLEGLQPQANLKSLEIYGFRGRQLSMWALKMAVQNNSIRNWIRLNSLMEIRLTSCHECKEAPRLGHLPNLKTLYLIDLPNVTFLGSFFYGDEESGMNTPFPMLERFKLSKMPKLIEWAEIGLSVAAETELHEVATFPCLKYLEIRNCNKLRNAPSHFPCLEELIIWGIESDHPLTNICYNARSLTKLQIEKVDGLICLPHELLFNNQKLSFLSVKNCTNIRYLVPHVGGDRTSLKDLEIDYCPNLRNLPEDLYRLSSLERMSISACQKLESLPYPTGGQSQGFPSLRWLGISKCSQLIELPCEMAESFAPTLEYLSLEHLSSLNLNRVLGRLKEMPRLRVFSISGVPKFTILPVEDGSLPMMQSLSFGPFSDSSDFPSFNRALESILGGVSLRIRTLNIRGRVHWGSLPTKLQNLTTLTHLELHSFGIESLPEWLGNLSSLEKLELFDCGRLRYLPSKEAMHRLTKLRALRIVKCPLLTERCHRPEEGSPFSCASEWAKISHISHLWIV